MPILYDANLGTLPDQQGWLEFGRLITGTQTLSKTSTGTLLNSTTLTQDATGYSNYFRTAATLKNSTFPSLNRSVGFSLNFSLQVLSETHLTTNRAGFSVTLLDQQGSAPQGIELGFWSNRIFSQAGGAKPFQSVAERVDGVNTLLPTSYSLRMLDQNYYLLAGNRLLLSGSVQAYNQAPVNPLLAYNPYSTPNFLFLGDNTSSASASVILGDVSLNVMQTGTHLSDLFIGSTLADNYNGMAGADNIIGMESDDWLAGGSGRDSLNGGAGNDFLMGGADADDFVFHSGMPFNPGQMGIDTIVDFDLSQDKIRLYSSTFRALPTDPIRFAASIAIVTSDNLAAASSAVISYNRVNGKLFYNPNFNAPGFASTIEAGGQFAQLWGAPNGSVFPLLSSSSFRLDTSP